LSKQIKIILASHNENKLIEFENILKKFQIKPLLLKNFTSIVPKENGKSFEENALIKSRFASKVVNHSMPSLADDSGLCIKNLNNQPGIYSRRWSEDNDYVKAYNKIKNSLEKKNITMNNQVAKFVCVLAFIDIDKKEHLYKGTLEGRIVFPPRGSFGFGYDPIFIPKGYNKTLAELKPSIKNSISHRRKAIKKLLSNKLFKI
jgi:XTP/dITP diphosphohydrolase